MPRSTTLLGAATLAVLLAACGGDTPTTPSAASPSALTPGTPSFDEIPNNLDGTVDATAEVMSLVAGGATGTTNLYVVPTGGDGKPGCNLTGSTTLVVAVSSSDAAVATVGPSSVTFTSCGDVKVLTVTPLTAGTTTISVSQVSNSTGGSFNFAPATFTVNVAPANVATSLALAAPSPASVVGGSAGPVALGATLTRTTGGAVVAGATIAFTVDGNAAGTATTSPGGVATVSYDPSSLAVGPHTVQATFAGATIGGVVYTSASSGTQALSVSDASGPVIVPTVTGTLGTNGWYTGDVSVSWSVTDPESAVGSTTGCNVTTISGDTPGQTVTCGATSVGGTSSNGVTIKRDATAPTANATRAPAANAHGWNDGTVTVSFAGTDATSGIASCSAAVALSGEGAGQSASGTCTDAAGNTSAPAGVTDVNIDRTAPTIGGSRSPAANAQGWSNTDVAVSFSCSDALSGVDGCGPNLTVSSEGANQAIPGTAVDRAGNTASTSVTGISIDRTAPTAIATASPAANANGWNNTDVSVTFTPAPGDLSGIASCTAMAQASAETTASGQPVSGVCTDNAGNTSAAATLTIRIDKGNPTITGTVSPAPNAAGWNNSTATVTFTCADALSGVDGCTTPVSFGSEGSSFSATGHAVDNAGNTASTTVSPVKIDRTAPVVSLVWLSDPDIQTVTGTTVLSANITEALSGVPANGATYTLNGGPAQAMSVSAGSATANITGLAPGLYNACVQVADVAGNASAAAVETCAYLAVYDPNGGFVTGGGWINSPPGACRNWSACTSATVGKANFGFVSKYLPGRTTAPEGNTEFQFQAGDLRFKSTSYETLIVAGSRAQFWGTGTVNGAGSFAFRLTAVDGTPDQFRMELWNGARDDNARKIYDNQWGAAQDAALATGIGGGSIQIKR